MNSARIKLKDRTPENDIKYCGFLSYRHLRIIGWACLVIAQITAVLSMEASVDPSSVKVVDTWKNILGFFANFPVPLFMLANFSNILQKKENYRNLLMFYGFVALLLYVLANVIIFHYGHGFLHSLNSGVTLQQSAKTFGLLLMAMGKSGYSLNIFIDLFLCSLLFFFLNYNPKSKIFAGKRVAIFRSLIILPIAYEVASIIVKYFMYFKSLSIPSYAFFLLTSKPPFIFLAFLLIVICLKIGEVKHLKQEGNDKETYKTYIQTNAHSLRVSIMIAVVFVICAALDAAISIPLMTVDSYNAVKEISDPELAKLFYEIRMENWTSMGLTGSIPLVLVAPLALLYSYSKTHKNSMIDKIIPVAGIGLILFVYIEGTFEVITCNMPNFIAKLKEIISGLYGGGGETPPTA